MLSHLNKFDQFREIKRIFYQLVGNDRKFIWLSIIYGVAISFLTLAVPVSVQFLINSIAHTASVKAVIMLSLFLFFLLVCSGSMTAFQSYLLELFERRFFARITSEIALHTLYADCEFSQNTNKVELTNRYFDIFNIQKAVTGLIIGMFALMLQMAVGIVVVSSYHPYLLLFNCCFIAVLWMIWRIWGYDATTSAVETSEAKYETARYLEDVARASNFYSTHSHSQHAIKQTDKHINYYLSKRRQFFKFSFSQHIALLAVYALASAGLLGVGGILVINEQLTLGQLIASELILSAIFYGASRLGYSMSTLYEMGASLEEIFRLYLFPLEVPKGSSFPKAEKNKLSYVNTEFHMEDKASIKLHFDLLEGQKVSVHCASYKIQQLILQSIVRHIEPSSGRIMYGNTNYKDINPRKLRDKIIAIDTPNVVETTLYDYLTMGKHNLASSDIYTVLEMVELNRVIDALDHGLDTHITPAGLPLSPTQTIRLKLAAALLAKPKILILNQFCDTISGERHKRIFTRLKQIPHLTILYFSKYNDPEIFDHSVYVDHEGNIT